MICRRNGIEFETRDVNAEVQVVSNEDEALVWIINNQLARRNVNLMCRAELVLAKKDILARQAKERMLAGVKVDPNQNSGEGSFALPQVDKILARESSVSHDTIYKVNTILTEAADEKKYTNDELKEMRELVDEARKGRESINRVYTIVKEFKDAKQAIEDKIPGDHYGKMTPEEIAASAARIAALRKDTVDKNDLVNRKKEARQLKISGVTTTADYFAAKAVAELSQIRKEDTGRAAAMQSVIDWIEQNK
jgi:predicted transcriptional regulator